MNDIELPLGQWLPDQADYHNPGLTVAENVYPSPGGYSPFLGPMGTDHTTTEPVQGAAHFFRNDGTSVIAGGSETKLFVRLGPGITETGSMNALAGTSKWRFDRYNDRVIAVCPENDPKTLVDVDSNTSWVDLGGSPPRASVVGRINDFVMMGDLTDIDASTQPSRVRWSALNNPAGNWVTDYGELSDYRTLDPRFGRITGIVSGRVGLVFQERAIWRVEFVGAPTVFRFDRISEGRGCIAPDSIVRRGFEVYFLSHDGFCVTNGSGVDVIGAGRVNQWFVAARNDARVDETQGAVNWPARCIVWNFIPSTSEVYSAQMIFNFELQTWSYARFQNAWLVEAKIDGTTLADLTTAYPGGIGTIPEPIGSTSFLPRGLGFAAFVSSGTGSEFVRLNGEALAAEMTMGNAQLVGGKRTMVSKLFPMVETTSDAIRTQVMTRASQGASPVTSAEAGPGVDGWHPHRADGMFIAPRIRIPAGTAWDKASAIMVRGRPSGRR